MSVERVVLPTDVVPSHYFLDLKPDLDKLEFYCDEEIDVTVTKEGVTAITLHQKEIYINTVVFKTAAGAEGPAITDINYSSKMTTVQFVFDGPLPAGEGKLYINFRGILNGDMAGFYKSNYSDANGNKKIMASTQFEALDARRAFPCWDEPAMKATFTVAVTVTSDLTALSNMPETKVTHLAGNKKRYLFQKSPKMSTYLLAWAIGEFDHVQAVTKNGVTLRVFAPPGRAEQCNFALDCGVRALDFFDEFFKVPYPLPKMDMICITDFAMGAMENWGLVTYREVALMIDDVKASVQAKQRVAIVVAHELAHQWFGNLVTMEWWDGLWLNEGFAAYMEHFCIDELFPEYEIWNQFTTDAFSSAQRLDSLKSSHPVIVPIKHAEEVEQVFDAISYCKGSTVVRMVATILGKDKFKEGLQNYMKQHAYGNTSTADLWAAWSKASGKDVPQLMNTWTTVMGHPYVTVSSENWNQADNTVTFTLRQQRFLSDGSSDSADDATLWCIPLMFASPGALSDESEAVVMTAKEQTFTIPLNPAVPMDQQWIKINAGQKALCRVAHSAEMTRRLKMALVPGADGKPALAAVDRAALLLDSYALAKAGLGSIESVVEVLKACKDETDSTVWGAIGGVLGGLQLLMEQTNAATYAAFKSFGKQLVLAALGRVGWEPTAQDTHTSKMTRTSVMALLDAFCSDDATVVAEARRRFDGHFDDASMLPSEYKMAVYRIVLANGGKAEYDRVMRTYTETEDNQERKYAMNTLGSTADVSLKMATLDWAVKSGEVKLQDFFYPIGSVSGDAAGVQMTWQYFTNNFAYIKEKLAKASPSLMDAVIVYSVNRFCTLERAAEIEAFFKANPLPQSERRIAQTLENMRTNAHMLKRIAASQLADAAFWA